MATKKSKPSQDDLPRCDQCAAGEFETGDPLGECKLLPMDWHIVEGEWIARCKPAVAENYCLHFVRRTH